MTENAPTFNFARGNAQKILAVPLYVAGVVASFLVPRVAGRWVFGCGSGIGEGALALYRHVNASLDSGSAGRAPVTGAPSELIWLARDDNDLKIAVSLGVPVVLKSTLHGFLLTLRAHVIVVTHGLGDVNRYATRGAFILQLWHGIPLKRIHLDTQQTTSSPLFAGRRWMRALLKRTYRLAASTISLIPAASALSATRLRTAFGLPAERIVVTGDPRDDVLCQGTEAQRTAVARATLFGRLGVVDDSQRVIFYAPTWRDGEEDPSVPTEEEWGVIDGWLRTSGSVLVIRPHPLGVGKYTAGIDYSARIHLLSSRLQSDINPVLAAADVLITDYSSIALDFSLLKRPIAFLAADLDSYTASRGLYEDYNSFSGGHHVSTWGALVSLLGENGIVSGHRGERLKKLADHAATLAERHHAFRDGRNTERVYDEVQRRLRQW